MEGMTRRGVFATLAGAGSGLFASGATATAAFAANTERTMTGGEPHRGIVKWYLAVLEGRIIPDMLPVFLQDDVRFSRDGKTWVEGLDPVTHHIKGWLGSVENTTIDLLRMDDSQDDCVKVDLVIHTNVRDAEGRLTRIQLPVIAMYTVANKKIHQILEYSALLPPGTQVYQ